MVESRLLPALFGGLMLVALLLAGARVLTDTRTMYIPLDSGAVLHLAIGRYQTAIQFEPGSHGVMVYKGDAKLCEVWLDNRGW